MGIYAVYLLLEQAVAEVQWDLKFKECCIDKNFSLQYAYKETNRTEKNYNPTMRVRAQKVILQSEASKIRTIANNILNYIMSSN